MTLRREGGGRAVWNTLHPQERAEILEAVRASTRNPELSPQDLLPLWEVLARWAAHRYATCVKKEYWDRRRARTVPAPVWEDMGPAPRANAATLKDAAEIAASTPPSDEKLPWES